MFSERKQQIIEVAISLIADKGIQNLTTKNLAKEIGISEPALYRHFESKLDILKNILKYFQLTINPALNNLQKKINAVDRIINFVNKHYKILSEKQDLAKIFFSEANFQNNDELKDSIMIMMKKSQQLLHDIIIEGQQKGEIKSTISATNMTRIIIGSMRFLVIQWSMSGMMFDLESEGKNLSKDLLKIMK